MTTTELVILISAGALPTSLILLVLRNQNLLREDLAVLRERTKEHDRILHTLTQWRTEIAGYILDLSKTSGEMRHRLSTSENNVESLRKRAHDLAGKIQEHAIRVDRLEHANGQSSSHR